MKKKNSLLLTLIIVLQEMVNISNSRFSFQVKKNSKIQPRLKNQDFFSSHTSSAIIADHNMKLGSGFFNFKPIFILLTFIFSAKSHFIIQQNYEQGTESFI